MKTVKVGVIGCGVISANYLINARKFPILDIVACADVKTDAAEARAKEFGVPRACTVDELLSNESIEIVLNLTFPSAHAQVALQAIEAGKHVYNEKPLAVDRVEGRQILEVAKARGVLVGAAPDTFLGAAHQTARHLVDTGQIGRPVAAACFYLGSGVKKPHPNMEFFYQAGGGPLFDRGPYFMSDLLQMLGPINRVTASATTAIPQRPDLREPQGDKLITVETPDHVSGTLEFANGCLATMVTSFAVQNAQFWPITIFGTEGTLRVPSPNSFDGQVLLWRKGEKEEQSATLTHCTGYGRSIGLADMAYAIRTGRAHRASGQQGLVVLETMHAMLESAQTGRAVDITCPYERSQPLPQNLPAGLLDE